MLLVVPPEDRIALKDEGTNLSTMGVVMHSIIDYEPLKILRVCEGMCFGHVMSKACQYATNDDKIYVGLKNVNVNKTHSKLQKTITCTKKSKKGRQEWERACFENGMWHHKLKTLVKIIFTNKVIMFEETFEFNNAIVLCYSRQKNVVFIANNT
jgi:hypothetical protein